MDGSSSEHQSTIELVDENGDDGGVGQSRYIAYRVLLAGSYLPQYPAHDLPGAGLRQVGEHDEVRSGDGTDGGPHRILQMASQSGIAHHSLSIKQIGVGVIAHSSRLCEVLVVPEHHEAAYALAFDVMREPHHC